MQHVGEVGGDVVAVAVKTALIKNWSKFQHYTNRCPPWIKLQRDLLDDFEFACLPIASKALAPMLWLLASESTDGTVRVDVDWLAFRLRWSVDDVKEGVTPLLEKGFLVTASDPLAPRYQDACLEGEGEGETEVEIPVANATGSGIVDSLPAVDGISGKATKRPACPFEQIVSLYHESLPTHPHVEKLTDARKGMIRQRWLQDLPSLDAWRNFFADVAASKFLTGRAEPRQGKPPFIADLEWLCRPSSFAKVAEGKYHR